MTYNHAFDFAFEVITDHESIDVTAQELRTALLNRVHNLDDNELIEACGMPFNSYEIEEQP